MYQFVLIWLVVAAVFQLFKSEAKLNKVFFWISVILLTYMQLFRYGQGADYWGYRSIYAMAPYKRGFELYWYTNEYVHGEPGFRLLINIFTAFGAPAFAFYGVFGTVIMVLVIVAIKRYVKCENLALLLFYHTFFMSYVLSGVRQAMVTAILLVLGLKLLEEKKYIPYIILTLLCATIHALSLFFLILLPIRWIKEKWILIGVPAAWIAGILITFTPIHTLLGQIPGLVRLSEVEISLGGLAERTLMFGIISILYWSGTRTDRLTLFYKIYTVGYLVAMAGMVTAYGSHRITMPFKMIEILLIPILLADCSRLNLKRICWCSVASVAVVMSLKNLNYYSLEYNAFNYPYVSIWQGYDAEKESGLEQRRLDWDETYNQH